MFNFFHYSNSARVVNPQLKSDYYGILKGTFRPERLLKYSKFSIHASPVIFDEGIENQLNQLILNTNFDNFEPSYYYELFRFLLNYTKDPDLANTIIFTLLKMLWESNNITSALNLASSDPEESSEIFHYTVKIYKNLIILEETLETFWNINNTKQFLAQILFALSCLYVERENEASSSEDFGSLLLVTYDLLVSLISILSKIHERNLKKNNDPAVSILSKESMVLIYLLLQDLEKNEQLSKSKKTDDYVFSPLKYLSMSPEELQHLFKLAQEDKVQLQVTTTKMHI